MNNQKAIKVSIECIRKLRHQYAPEYAAYENTHDPALIHSFDKYVELTDAMQTMMQMQKDCEEKCHQTQHAN